MTGVQGDNTPRIPLRPPSMIGGSVLVIDLRTGQPSVWPRAAAPNVAELYRKSKQGNG